MLKKATIYKPNSTTIARFILNQRQKILDIYACKSVVQFLIIKEIRINFIHMRELLKELFSVILAYNLESIK